MVVVKNGLKDGNGQSHKLSKLWRKGENMLKIPSALKEAIHKLARDNDLDVIGGSGYDKLDLTLTWFDKKTTYEIACIVFGEPYAEIVITAEEFIFLPALFIWCRNYVPFFSLKGKIRWKKIGQFSMDETEDVYYAKLKSIYEDIKANRFQFDKEEKQK